MNYFDEELESIANSIQNNIKKINTFKIFFYSLLFISVIFFLPLSIKYLVEQNPSDIFLIIFFTLFLISILGLTVTNDDEIISIFIFKNMEERIFFYLFCSWKYHNDKKSKKYLKKCIEAIDIYLTKYKNLAYTESIHSTFYNLRDVLKFHIYSKLGERGNVQNQGDLSSQVSAWDEFKSLSLDFYQKSSINLIDERVSNLKSHFELDETVEIANDFPFIRISKTIFNWNINMYKDSVTYRFVFYLMCTVIIDYYLISNNLVTNDILIPATVLIPIMAPYYLAPQKYKK